MRVLVAGGTGACGAPTVRQLCEAGHTVTLLARPDHRPAPPGIPVAIVDLTDPDATRLAVEAHRPDAIVSHISALPRSIEPRRLIDTYRMNDLVRAAGIHLARAGAAYGARTIVSTVAFWYAPGPDLATEDVPLWFEAPEPVSRSVWAMTELETAIELSGGVVLRAGAFVGPGTYYARDGWIGEQIATARFPIIDDGAGTTSFVHVEDVAGATLHALAIAPGIYNVADDDPAAEAEWITAFAAAYGGPAPSRVPAAAARLFMNRGVVAWRLGARGACNAKLRATGWAPAYPSWRAALAS